MNVCVCVRARTHARIYVGGRGQTGSGGKVNSSKAELQTDFARSAVSIHYTRLMLWPPLPFAWINKP